MDQIKTVCDGSDETIRKTARAKLIPLAKKHLPNSKWAQETLAESDTVYGMDICGQCRFFEDLSDSTKTAPAATGQATDSEVTISQGAIGPGVGRCSVDKELKRKNDSACSDGRPREGATDLDRTKEKTIEEMIMKSELEDVKAELLRERLAHREDIDIINERTKELTIAKDTLARKEKELAVLTGDNTRLKKDRRDLTEKLDRESEDKQRAELKVDGLEKDLDFQKDQVSA